MLACLLVALGCVSTPPIEGIEYDADIDGTRFTGVTKPIKHSTATWRLHKQPVSTLGQLRYRMSEDRPVIEAILEAHGYYDATVEMELDPEEEPVTARIKVNPGERYRLGDVQMKHLGASDEALERIKPRVRRKQRVGAENVFAEEERILGLMMRNGYPFPELVKRSVEVNHDTKTVDLTMVFDPGVKAYFGEVAVEGLESLDDKYVYRQLPWKAGQPYDKKLVDDFERKLLSSGVFGSIRVEPQEPQTQTNSIAVKILAKERDKRTIRLGVNYSDIGPGVKGIWVHRSFFGGGERLETSVEWNPIKLEGAAQLTRSGFLDAHQYLVLDLDISQETPEAYDARKATTSAMVFRDFTSMIRAGLGTGYKYSRVEQFDSDEHYAHVFFPLQATYDSRNDQLNPIRGMRVQGRTAYYNDTLGSESFFKTGLEGRHYAMLWERYRISSALRLALGSIDGASLDAVPADERFYAGGGGSVRGYEYQSIGAQIDGVPTGGDKLVEFSTELRLQPGRRLGYVAFIDGGTVYNELFDGYDRSLRFGAGLGLRWFTAVGPLRVDFAYPLNADAEQVERLQFYISLGQAF